MTRNPPCRIDPFLGRSRFDSAAPDSLSVPRDMAVPGPPQSPSPYGAHSGMVPAVISNSFPHGIMEEFAAMRDRCRELEDEVLQLKTERDTIKEMFRVVAANRENTGSSSIDPMILLPTNVTANRPTHDMHPQIRFWTRAMFLEWQESAEGHANIRGALPYLEQENGDPVDEPMAAEIRRTMRSAWAELRNRGLAPSSWGKVDHSGRTLFHQLVEGAHPLFRLAEGGWKLERLATSSYSGWSRTHLPDESTSEESENQRKRKGKLAPKNGAKRVKEEQSNETTATSSSESSYEPMEVDSETSGPSPTSTESLFPGSETTGPSTTQDIDVIDPLSDLYLEDGTLDQNTPSVCDPISVKSIASTSDDSVSTKSIVAINAVTVDSTISTSNPIKSVVASNSTISASDPVNSVIATSAFTQQSTPVESPKSVVATNAVVSDPTASAPPGPSSSGAPPATSANTKMRPGKAKNGRNLCGHRWLQQFRGRSGCGTTQEFQMYWSSLSKETQRRYEDEAHTLATTNAWSKAELEKTLY